ncbi:MAG: hypothetical protein J4G13_08570 [Dehalococcoidia bacterium]|nr:hypothetical protein [Dehalococcoidia bacterium]
MNWQQLIAVARMLASAPEYGERRGRPQQMQLRKAISAAYYAMFHALAGSNADTLIGASSQFRRLPAWTVSYRALDHGFARSRMQSGLHTFASPIQNFGRAFVDLQNWRHRADYDPNAELIRPDAVSLIDRAEAAIIGFEAVDATERKSFAAHVLFRVRTP